jgi:hypothetical protein
LSVEVGEGHADSESQYPKAQQSQTQNDHRLLGDGKPPCGSFSTATGLGLTGFLFPLLQPMLRMGGQPAIRQ